MCPVRGTLLPFCWFLLDRHRRRRRRRRRNSRHASVLHSFRRQDRTDGCLKTHREILSVSRSEFSLVYLKAIEKKEGRGRGSSPYPSSAWSFLRHRYITPSTVHTCFQQQNGRLEMPVTHDPKRIVVWAEPEACGGPARRDHAFFAFLRFFRLIRVATHTKGWWHEVGRYAILDKDLENWRTFYLLRSTRSLLCSRKRGTPYLHC